MQCETYNAQTYVLIMLSLFSVDTLDLRMQGKKLYLPGITEMFVETMDDIQTIMNVGDKNRSTAATKMNSTRSVQMETA